MSDTMKQAYNKNYAFQVWSTSLVLPLIFAFIIASIDSQSLAGLPAFIGFGLIILGVSLLYSLPALGVYYLSYRYLLQTPLSPFIIKLILLLVAAIYITITFYFFFGTDFLNLKSDLEFPLSYFASVTIASFLYKLTERKPITPDV
ncbi:hypothetical protein [Ferruginibacter sp. SUN106]|uniref:hypothetical protein n=1 Tax=Ferruginibacter sp. SUN106 TaxID=2978348 RepID=UPI003D36DEA8